MKNRFFLACTRENVGSNMGFHASKGGYTTNINMAKNYTLEEAQKAWEIGRRIDLPVSAEHIEQLSILKVDCQYIPCQTPEDLKEEDIVCAFKKRKYDGNDVYWLTTKISELQLNVDFDKCFYMTFNDLKSYFPTEKLWNGFLELFTVIKYEDANNFKRKTFEYEKLNKRKMITCAGLRIPEKFKAKNNRKK